MSTHQTTTPRLRRRLAAVLLLPLLLVLGGCFRLDMGITINENETADVSMEVADLTGFLSREDMDCSSLESEIVDAPEGDDIDFTVEETETDGNVGCIMTASGAPLDTFDDDSMSITKDGDNYVFAFSGDDAAGMGEMGEMPGNMNPEIAISVTFPGEVVEADENGEIDGNTVTWTGMEAFSTGGTATGAATGGALSGGSSIVIWIVLGVVALLAAAALVFFIIKKKQQGATPATAPYGGPAAPGAYGQPGAADYGQPAQPSAYGQPGAAEYGQPGAYGQGQSPVDAGAGYSPQPPTGPSVAATDAPVHRGTDEPFAPSPEAPQAPEEEPPAENR